MEIDLALTTAPKLGMLLEGWHLADRVPSTPKVDECNYSCNFMGRSTEISIPISRNEIGGGGEMNKYS